MCLWGHCWRRLLFESVNWVMKIPLLMWVDIIQSVESQKNRKRANLLSFSWDIHFLPPTLMLLVLSLGLRVGVTPLTPPVLRPSYLGWNYAQSLTGSQACRQKLVGHLSLHNHMSQSLIVSLFLYSYVLFFCFSEESWLIQWTNFNFPTSHHHYHLLLAQCFKQGETDCKINTSVLLLLLLLLQETFLMYSTVD